MFKTKRVLLFLVALLVTAVMLTGCGGAGSKTEQKKEADKKAEPAKAGGKYEITWGTAPAGGSWQVLGTAMLEDILKANPNYAGSTVPVGGAGNVMGVADGKLNIAFSLSTTTGDAWDGLEPFKEKGQIRNIRLLATLFPEPTQFVVLANSDIDSFEKLKGRKVTPGPKGSAVETDSRKVLEVYNMSYKDIQPQFISYEEAAQQMLDGHIDAIMYGAMIYPAPGVVNIASQKPIKMISMSDDKIKELMAKYKGFIPYTYQKGSYKGVDYEVKAVASMCNIIARDDVPDEVAYNVVKAIAENFDRYATVTKAMTFFKKEDMAREVGIPMHPGALKYYKEKGWIK